MKTLFVATVLFAATVVPVHSLADDAETDPAKLYLEAGRLVDENAAKNVMCPAASNLEYDEVPPYPADWYKWEDADYPANAPARALAHRARSLDHPHWPGIDLKKPDLKFLNELRSLANELSDAVVYEHLRGDDAAAIETARDELHLAELLEGNGDKEYVVMLLVGQGIRAVTMSRLMVAAADLHVSDDPADKGAARTAAVTDLIKQLCDLPDPAAAVAATVKAEQALGGAAITGEPLARLTTTVKRAQAECGTTALSLACHLYKARNGTWPKSLADLKPFCPTVPTDPFGDGKQTLGYAVIPHGLPDGGDRPLVYFRETDDGTLAYRDATSAYGYYVPDHAKGVRGVRQGQFRDVVLWKAAPDAKATMAAFAEP